MEAAMAGQLLASASAPCAHLPHAAPAVTAQQHQQLPHYPPLDPRPPNLPAPLPHPYWQGDSPAPAVALATNPASHSPAGSATSLLASPPSATSALPAVLAAPRSQGSWAQIPLSSSSASRSVPLAAAAASLSRCVLGDAHPWCAAGAPEAPPEDVQWKALAAFFAAALQRHSATLTQGATLTASATLPQGAPGATSAVGPVCSAGILPGLEVPLMQRHPLSSRGTAPGVWRSPKRRWGGEPQRVDAGENSGHTWGTPVQGRDKCLRLNQPGHALMTASPTACEALGLEACGAPPGSPVVPGTPPLEPEGRRFLPGTALPRSNLSLTSSGNDGLAATATHTLVLEPGVRSQDAGLLKEAAANEGAVSKAIGLDLGLALVLDASSDSTSPPHHIRRQGDDDISSLPRGKARARRKRAGNARRPRSRSAAGCGGTITAHASPAHAASANAAPIGRGAVFADAELHQGTFKSARDADGPPGVGELSDLTKERLEQHPNVALKTPGESKNHEHWPLLFGVPLIPKTNSSN